MEDKLPPGKFSVNYGLLLGVLMIGISIILYATGMALEGVQWPIYIYYIAFPVIIIYAISKYKSHSAGYLSLGEALKIGLVIAAISGLAYALYALGL